TPEERRDKWRDIDATQEARKIIRSGPDYFGEVEVVPLVLTQWFDAHSIQPERGQRGYFSGRGSYVAVEEQRMKLEQDYAAIMRRIEAELALPLEVPEVAL